MSLTSTFQNLAVTLLDKFEAMPATLRRVSRVYDPLTQDATVTNIDIATKVIFSTLNEMNSAGQTVYRTTATLAALPLAAVPMSGDLLIAGGTTYRVESVEAVSPSGVALVYRLTLGDA